MTTFAIGDIHGCFATLQRLLAKIKFVPGRDRLWLVGDLVNRGPRSLEVLRWAKANDSSLVVTLGNHDLHLLACAAGFRTLRAKDALGEVLAAHDRDDLLHWLRHRPLLHTEAGWSLLHAGLHPAWDLPTATTWARACEARLRATDWMPFLSGMYGENTLAWHEAREKELQLQCALRVFSALRVCDARGTLNNEYTGPPAETPAGYHPWYNVPGRRHAGTPAIFGHWAAAGHFRENSSVCVDSGCAWGKALTAFEPDSGKVEQVANEDLMTAKK